MSKKIFTEQEIQELSKNKYVKNVTSKGITYTNEFKLQFIAEYGNGKTSRKIFEFEDAGFNVDIIGIKRIDSASLRWRTVYKDKGVLGLEDTRTLNSGRTLNREFKQNIPGKVMLTDITYMPYGNNKMAYLSTIKDSSTNEILAYDLSNRLAINIVTETINKVD